MGQRKRWRPIGCRAIVGVEVGEDASWYDASFLLGHATDERRIEDVATEEFGGGGAADETTDVGARDDLEQ